MAHARADERAAPADDGGHRGSYTEPQDEMIEPHDSQLFHDQADDRQVRHNDRGITFTWLLLVLGMMAVLAYCSMTMR